MFNRPGNAELTNLPQNLAMANKGSCVDEVRRMAPELIDPDPMTGEDDIYCVVPASDVL